MRDILFLIFKNQKLDFLDSSIYVYEFIKKRFEFYSANNIEFIDRCDQKSIIENFYNKADFIVVSDSCNPIIDFELVSHMIESLGKAGVPIAVSDGAIPGTQVEYIINSNAVRKLKNYNYIDHINVRCFSQNKYNNQFNLFKYKRLKLFLFIVREIECLYKMSIDEIIMELEKEEIFYKLISFGEDVKLNKHINCPHCKGDLVPLPMTMSQAFCGYIPLSKPLYNECQKCGLVLISPYIEASEVHKIYDNFDKQDFVLSCNNPYHKLSARCDFNDIILLLPEKTRTLDIGGGIGNFSKFLKENYPNWEITHSDFTIKENKELNKLNIKTRSINFLKEEIGKNLYDLITAWEVIEHIPYEKLSDTLDNVYNSLSNNGIFMFSTPDFDSPLCKHNDFFAICPPFHYLVFGKKWIEDFFKNNSKWEILSIRHCSDFLDDSNMWYDYTSKTSPSMQLRATSILLKNLLEHEANKKLLLEKGYGTEIIVTLLKK